jgi:hypothetical protein
MGWNRERITFVLSALVLLGSILHAAGSFLGGDATSIQLQEPAPAQRGIVGGRVTIDWYQGEGGAIRDPYQAKSDWRSARPDTLALPPYGALERRIPLPAPVASAPRAWPGLEPEPPKLEGGTE